MGIVGGRLHCDKCYGDGELHAHFIKKPFKWMRPRLVNRGERVATNTHQWHIGFNRYPHNIIGIGVVIAGRQFVINWKRS